MPEPKDKLDTSVNGPEDPRPVFPAFDGDAWERVDWRRCEEEVRRLRSRIFKAVQERDMATAVDLQKLMLRSWHNTLVSVRQVTQRNTGRKTAGIDGLVALTSQARAEMAVRVHATRGSHQPSPVRRVYIPKASDKTKMRPLGIPVILDRCHQARVRNALEPEWEARFEPRSYGFRPGRGCHDAIGSLFNTLRGKGKRVWILDADLAGAFDKIDHEHLLKAIGGFPAREMIADWLRAGISEAGKGYLPTEEGTPQGGLCAAAHKPPCGVPRSRCRKVPSGSRSGAWSHRRTYSTTHGRSVFAWTALTTRSQGTLSNESPTYYRYRGPRRGDPGVGEGLAAHRGGR